MNDTVTIKYEKVHTETSWKKKKVKSSSIKMGFATRDGVRFILREKTNKNKSWTSLCGGLKQNVTLNFSADCHLPRPTNTNRGRNESKTQCLGVIDNLRTCILPTYGNHFLFLFVGPNLGTVHLNRTNVHSPI